MKMITFKGSQNGTRALQIINIIYKKETHNKTKIIYTKNTNI